MQLRWRLDRDQTAIVCESSVDGRRWQPAESSCGRAIWLGVKSGEHKCGGDLLMIDGAPKQIFGNRRYCYKCGAEVQG